MNLLLVLSTRIELVSIHYQCIVLPLYYESVIIAIGSLTAYCVFKPREFHDSEPVQDVLLVPGETEHDRICRYHYDNNDHHIFLDRDDDMQHENQ